MKNDAFPIHAENFQILPRHHDHTQLRRNLDSVPLIGYDPGMLQNDRLRNAFDFNDRNAGQNLARIIRTIQQALCDTPCLTQAAHLFDAFD